jgi:hypothetical protein
MEPLMPGSTTGLTGFYDQVRAVSVATDGSGDVYTAGFFSDYNGTAVTSGLARLNSERTVESGFVPDPGVISRSSFITRAIDQSNDIYVTGGDLVRMLKVQQISIARNPEVFFPDGQPVELPWVS